MAGLKKRGNTYSITFSRRTDGKLEQKAFALGVSRRDKAERMKVRFEDDLRAGLIDPFDGSWSPLAKTRAAPSAGTSLEEAIRCFLASRSHVRGRTRRDYEQQGARLAEAVGPSMPVRLVTEADVRAYAFQPHLSNASQTTYLRFCRMLFRWLTEAGLVETDVAAVVKYPKREVKVSTKILTPDELQTLLSVHSSARRAKATAGESRGCHLWFRPLAATFFYAGLRAREGAELRWERVDLERGYILISESKSGRERIIPIRQALLPYLAAWHRYSGRPARGLVFPHKRTATGETPLSTEHISKTFKAYTRTAKLPETVTLHGLRHSCATDLLRNGMGINEVASILGHSSIEVTRIYEHLDETDLRAKMRRLGL